jgi:ribose 5-phosphate isomerase A
MALAVEEISAMLHHNNLNVRFIPTSHQIENVIVTHGLQLTSLHSSPRPDLALDGADQVDDALNLIKGGGAAMMREKIAAEAARRFVVIIEEQKRVNQLSRPVPLEVLLCT